MWRNNAPQNVDKYLLAINKKKPTVQGANDNTFSRLFPVSHRGPNSKHKNVQCTIRHTIAYNDRSHGYYGDKQVLQQYCTLPYSKEILKPGKPVLEGSKSKENNMTTDPLQICSSVVLGSLYYAGRDGVVANR